jgi:tagatose-6-phosphate ketose/aldose isomerase
VNDSTEFPGLSAAQARAAGASWTAREIAQQPALWPQIARAVSTDKNLEKFLAPLLADPGLRIVLTGAGTSAFIGSCLAPALCKSGRQAQALSTTDIVTSPGSTLSSRGATLMVHFARSGGSPESVATLALAEQLLENCAHLIVTCNPDGELKRRAVSVRRAHTIVLPEACNDQSFAMTSSFTGMLLAAAIALRVVPAAEWRLTQLSRMGTEVLRSHVPLTSALVRAQFDRVVYLGSNELKGLASEAALKMLELTDGRVVSVGDSPLGFRHGPKTIVNGSTLVVTFLSADPYARRYDLDLLNELRREAVAGRVIALSTDTVSAGNADTLVVGASDDLQPAQARGSPLTDLDLCLPYAIAAQTLALLRSISLGLTPDNPNAAGTVSRVVQGVSIYPFPGPV